MIRYLLCILFCLPLLLSKPLLGQTENEQLRGFGVTPTVIKIGAVPGRIASSKFTIATHDTKDPVTFKIEIKDMGQNETGDVRAVEIGKGVRSAAEMISIESEIEIQPDDRRDISFTVTVPQDARGAYYAYILVSLKPDRPQAVYAASVIPSATIDISVLTRSEAPFRVDVREFSAQPSGVSGYGELTLLAVNTGDWQASVEGDVLLYGNKKDFPTRLSISYSRGETPVRIYPGASVILHCPIYQSLPSGEYNVIARLLLDGKYKSVSHGKITFPESKASKRISGQFLSKSEFDLDIVVEPDMVELTLTPGAVRTVQIRIQNRDERPTQVQASIRDVRMEKSGILTFPTVASEDNQLISLIPDHLVIDPKRSASIKAMITVPRDTSDMGTLMKAVHLYVTGPQLEGGWKNETEYGVLLVATDPRAAPPKLEVNEVNVIQSNPETIPTAAIITLNNLGDKVARFEGQITVERVTGQSIATMEIGKRQAETILPGATREFRMVLPIVDAGDFRVRAEFATTEKEPIRASGEATFSCTAEIPEGLR